MLAVQVYFEIEKKGRWFNLATGYHSANCNQFQELTSELSRTKYGELLFLDLLIKVQRKIKIRIGNKPRIKP